MAQDFPLTRCYGGLPLDIVATVPLDDVDTFGGTIVTEWYQLNQNTDERIKIAIFVLDRELRSDGIRVIGLCAE